MLYTKRPLRLPGEPMSAEVPVAFLRFRVWGLSGTWSVRDGQTGRPLSVGKACLALRTPRPPTSVLTRACRTMTIFRSDRHPECGVGPFHQEHWGGSTLICKVSDGCLQSRPLLPEFTASLPVGQQIPFEGTAELHSYGVLLGVVHSKSLKNLSPKP